MRLPPILTVTLLSAALLATPLHVFAQDDDSAADKSDAKPAKPKPAAKPAPKSDANG